MKTKKPAVDQSLIEERKAVQKQLASDAAALAARKREDALAAARGLRGATSLISGSSGGSGFLEKKVV
jgi:hypothetical protein